MVNHSHIDVYCLIYVDNFISFSGTNHLYVFINPKKKDSSPDLPREIDWEFAQKEIAQAKGFATGANASLTKGWYFLCKI